MSLLTHESQHWPIAFTVVQGEATLEQHLESLASWDRWFSKNEPFHVIRVYLDDASLRHSEGVAQATQRWMSEGAAEKMRELVQSMLIVVPSDQYARMKKMSVRKAFGIPGGLFASLEDACAWLDNPTEAVKGLPVDKTLLDAMRLSVNKITKTCETSNSH